MADGTTAHSYWVGDRVDVRFEVEGWFTGTVTDSTMRGIDVEFADNVRAPVRKVNVKIELMKKHVRHNG